MVYRQNSCARLLCVEYITIAIFGDGYALIYHLCLSRLTFEILHGLLNNFANILYNLLSRPKLSFVRTLVFGHREVTPLIAIDGGSPLRRVHLLQRRCGRLVRLIQASRCGIFYSVSMHPIVISVFVNMLVKGA